MEDFQSKSIEDIFSDVIPIPTEKEENGMCVLTLNNELEKYVSYLRACIQSGEISKRVYYLTEKVINCNTTFISAWVVRQKCIETLQLDPEYEWQFMEYLRNLNPKCYQTWMHRRFLVGLTGDFRREKDFCDSYIICDNKNIHSWTHRMWIVETFQQYEGELEYTDNYIEKDIFNNSAWSHRFYCFTYMNKTTNALPAELGYVMERLSRAPHNEAAWNYLRGLTRHYKDYDYSDIEYSVKMMLKDDPRNIPAREFLIEYFFLCFDMEKFEEGMEYCLQLEKEDTTRSAYWKSVEQRILSNIRFLQEMQ